MIPLSLTIIFGIAAQWVAWRLRLPAILLLLGCGLLAGVGSEFVVEHGWINNTWALQHVFVHGKLIDPNALFGDTLQPIIALAVAVILFEGGLTLRWRELTESRGVIISLVTVGALVTWIVVTFTSQWLLDLDWRMAVMLGSILIVTGPTVIGPLLRHVKPTGAVTGVLKWEGIVIDPIGALLAVLTYEALKLDNLNVVAQHAGLAIARTVIVGLAVGMLVGWLLMKAVDRDWLPEHLHTLGTLMLVVLAFFVSNLIQAESGLLTVTVMGIFMANQRRVPIRSILEFKESLSILLISSLFILLGSRLMLDDLKFFDLRLLAFLCALVLIARPLSVAVATIGSKLTRAERLFLCFMAPRGIVAAAVSAVFAIRLVDMHVAGAERLAPYTFAVIVFTVLVYGLLAKPAAKWLKIGSPDNLGVVIAGANPIAQQVGQTLKSMGCDVVLIDTNYAAAREARMAGLRSIYGSVLDQFVVEPFEFSRFGRLIAMTPSDKLNLLAAIRFAPLFGKANVYRAAPASQSTQTESTVPGEILADADLTFDRLQQRLASGGRIVSTKLSDQFTFEKLKEVHGDDVRVLFIQSADGAVTVHSPKSPPFRAGDNLVFVTSKPKMTNERKNEETEPSQSVGL